jgi:ribosomal protein L11 methyltransferase
VTVPAARAEQARARMLALFPEGFQEQEADGGVELIAYTSGRGEEKLWQAFGAAEADDVEEGWEDRWRTFHRPVVVGGLWIGPPWETPEPGLPAVTIEPGRAFGTGAHPTTRLCVELLAARPPGSVLDVGCGSGVLAIAAARLGFDPVTAVDSERAALDATLENARANGVALDAVARADLRSEPAPAADVITANLVRPLLLRVAGLMDHPPGALIVSGLLAGEEDEVAAAFAPLTEARRLTDADWSALLLLGPAYT